jgi:hypothetical protein
MSNNTITFNGVYKVTMPKVTEAKNEREKAAFTEMAMNTVIVGTNSSIDLPRVNDKNSIYFNIHNNFDEKFENVFKQTIEDCNKKFNVDMAKKAYLERVSIDEYNNAKPLE